MSGKFRPDGFREEDFGPLAEAFQPAVENGGDDDFCCEREVLVSVRHKHCVFAEPVEDHARERVLEAELYLLRLPGEHAEDRLSVAREIERFGLLRHDARLLGDGELCHLVHAIVRQTVALGVGDEVVVFIVPDEGIGTREIVARALVLAAVHAPVEVAEANLKVPGDGLVMRSTV